MTTFNVYRREANDTNPPVAIATGLASKAYVDDTVVYGKDYLYSIGAIRDTREKISNEILVNAIIDDVAPIVVGTTASSFTQSTGQTKATPSGTQAGDLIIAFVMHRSALTAPQGWTLVYSAECSDSGITSYASVYSKIAIAADLNGNVAFTQAASGRISLALMSFRHARGCRIIDKAKSDYASQVDGKIKFSEFTPTNNGVAVNFGSWIYAVTGTDTSSYTATSGYSLVNITSTSDALNQIRSGIAYKSIGKATLNTGRFEITPEESNYEGHISTACSIAFLVTYNA